MVLRIAYTKAVVIITCIQNVNLSQGSRYLNKNDRHSHFGFDQMKNVYKYV